jgi:hypothetical protein
MSVVKKHMSFMNDEGVPMVAGETGRVVSRYPGRMLPPKIGVK